MSIIVVNGAPKPISLSAPDEGGGNPGEYADRLIDWTPRVYTGVTQATWDAGLTRTLSATAEQAALTGAAAGYKDGTLDATALIQAAITAAVAHTYVEIPVGTWRLDSGLSMGQADDNVTLRGADKDNTILDCRIGSIGIALGTGYTPTGWPTGGKTITAYGTSGNNSVLTVDDTSDFTVGALVYLQFLNDPAIPVVSVVGYGQTFGSGNDAPTRQATRLVSKTATQLTVFPPIHGMDEVDGLSAKVWGGQWASDGIAVENLYMTAATTEVTQTALVFDNCYNSWVKDVTFRRFQNYVVKFQDSVQCEARRCFVDEGGTGGSNGAGIYLSNTTGGLFEDNIIRNVFPNIEVNAGSVGNAFLYNFCHNDNPGHACLHTNHGPHNRYNLYEGNVTGNVLCDGYFGGEAYLTLFRNLVHGNAIDPADTLTFGVSLKRFTRYATVVGNVFGGPESTAGTYLDVEGTPNIGNAFSKGTAQPSVGDWWEDINSDGSTPLRAQLTTRTDDLTGKLTFSVGGTFVGGFPRCWSTDGNTLYGYVTITSDEGGGVYGFTSAFVLPALNTNFHVWAGQGATNGTDGAGFQERDLDVDATTIRQDNWNVFNGAFDAVSGGPLPDSLVYDAEPSWWPGSLAWPPVNPSSPDPAYAIIPAGYRYLNAGADPP